MGCKVKGAYLTKMSYLMAYYGVFGVATQWKVEYLSQNSYTL